jgi:hypothetical protein
MDDPDIDMTNEPKVGRQENLSERSAIWLGGSWYAVNGALIWALGSLDGTVADARYYAWDEFKRNTLAAHANAFPDHWHGIINVDDFCYSFYSPREPARCGNAELLAQTRYYGQNTHQPAWLMFNAIKMAGFDPVIDGYTIHPRIPLEEYSLRLPTVGIHIQPQGASGYFRLENNAALKVKLKRPASCSGEPLAVSVSNARVPHEEDGEYVTFVVPKAPADTARGWLVACRTAAKIRLLAAPRLN